MDTLPTVCPSCKGEGVVPSPGLQGDEIFLDEVCERCGGEGWLEDDYEEGEYENIS
jgi:DnaJ-class molecular chaperone